MKQAIEKVAAELQTKGYKKRKTVLYRKCNDIIIVYAFERPSDLLYVQFCVIPLYAPNPGYVYYTYGGRFNNIFDDVPVLPGNASEAEKAEWSDIVIGHINNSIEPFCNAISSADGMNAFLKKTSCLSGTDWKMSKYINATPDNLILLTMYCSIFQREFPEALIAAKEYISDINNNGIYTAALASKKVKDVKEIISMLEGEQYDSLNELCSKWIRDNLELFHFH